MKGGVAVERSNLKTIAIDKNMHQKVKEHTDSKGMKIRFFVEEVLEEALAKLSQNKKSSKNKK